MNDDKYISSKLKTLYSLTHDMLFKINHQNMRERFSRSYLLEVTCQILGNEAYIFYILKVSGCH